MNEPARGGPRVGLALSGGAVLGMAHLGVIGVLEELQVPIHCIAGTSAGSLVGAYLAAGKSYGEIRAMARDLSWSRIARLTIPSRGLFSGELLEHLIEDTLGPVNIEELPRGFACTAVDLVSGEERVFDSGPLAPAVRASCAIPGVFTPLDTRDGLYADGGLREFLPVRTVRALGAEVVIGVKLIPVIPKGRRPRNILEILLTSFHLMVGHVASLEPGGEVTIVPDLSGLTSYDFGGAEELIERGARAARAEADRIRWALDGAARDAG